MLVHAYNPPLWDGAEATLDYIARLSFKKGGGIKEEGGKEKEEEKEEEGGREI